MGNRYASGKHAIAECDRCSFRFKLSELRKLTVAGVVISTKVCKQCWEPDHPQLMQGRYPVDDPQAIREPRPDLSYAQSGLLADGSTGEGSRVTQWGWGPVGLSNPYRLPVNNALLATGSVGQVTISIT